MSKNKSTVWPETSEAFQAVADEAEDLVGFAAAVDLHHDFLEERQDAVDLRVVIPQAHPDGFLLIVAAVYEAVHDLGWRGLELQVVDVAGLGVQTTAAATLHEHLVRHLDEQEFVHLQARIHHGLSLIGGAREAIEEAALLLDVGLHEPVLDEVDDELAGHEAARVHEALRLEAQLGALLHVVAQDVARGDVHVAELLLDLVALRALARGRRAGDHDQGRGAAAARPRARRGADPHDASGRA
mmetsp:Transcript_47190/g.126208  ORF Transcript_47190/g.126208 Transcript_47190/m.126208 type:complete len:242 (-) Transcript_47190:35-760(-)